MVIVNAVTIQEIESPDVVRWRWDDYESDYEIVWLRHTTQMAFRVRAKDRDIWSDESMNHGSRR
jgi:hypothetical protein